VSGFAAFTRRMERPTPGQHCSPTSCTTGPPAPGPLSVSTPTNDRVVHAILTLLPKNVISRGNGWNAMKKREMSPPRAGAANTTIKPESRDLSVAAWRAIMTETDTEIAPFIQNIEAASIAETETDTEIAPLIQKVGAASIAEIDRLIAELQEAKSYLQSEGERIEREMVRYANLTQMALASAMIIFDAVSQWHPARNQQKTDASEVTAASTEDDIAAFRKSHHHSRWDTSELGQAADDTEGTQPLK